MAERSLFVSVLTLVDTLRISGQTVAASLRGRLTEDSTNELLAWWSHRVVAHAGIRVRTQGLGHREDGRAYVIMSNHQSHYDIPVLFYALGPNMRMVAKKELFKFPLFGPAMRRAGFIEVDRADKKRAIESLDHGRDAIERGVSIWIAPEGTRSQTGELLSFKKGGFFLAMKTGAPILPVTVRGTRDVLAAHAYVPTRGRDVDVIVHAPIDVDPNDNAPKARDALMSRVRAAIQSGLEP